MFACSATIWLAPTKWSDFLVFSLVSRDKTQIILGATETTWWEWKVLRFPLGFFGTPLIYLSYIPESAGGTGEVPPLTPSTLTCWWMS